jgi:hypothetical protein
MNVDELATGEVFIYDMYICIYEYVYNVCSCVYTYYAYLYINVDELATGEVYSIYSICMYICIHV